MATHRERFLRKHNLPKDTSLSIPEISNLSGVPVEALHQVYRRGLGAASTNMASVRLLKDFSKNPDTKRYGASDRLSGPQWAMARIFSFVQGGKTRTTADADIARKYSL